MEGHTRFWNNLKLRFSLFRIWFMKNIKVFIQVFCIVCLVCIFTGTIDANTPILGSTIYVLLEPLVSEINSTIANREIENLMTFFSIIISVLISIGMFTAKVRRIAITDIKNDKLKYALIQANLYFNSDGVLVKKMEKAIGEDIDGDGKIDTDELEAAQNKKGFFKSIVDAVKEFNTIMKADFGDTVEESNETYKDVLEDADLEDAAVATKEIDKIVEVGVSNIIIDKAIDVVEDEAIETVDNQEIDMDEKLEKISLLEKIKNFFTKKKKDVHEELENLDTEIITNNIENDAEVSGGSETAETPVEKTQEQPTPTRTLSKKEQALEALRNQKAKR